MLRVMIAEDEILVRTGLSVSIEWERLNLQVVAEVNNGNDAYYSFIKYRPEIIVTDIRMPGMDGLTLIQKIREMDSQCQIIVISCLTDFETLHEAMQFNISSYLIKATMTLEDVQSALEGAISNLQQNPTFLDDAMDSSQILNNALTDYLVLRSIDYSEFSKRLLQEGVAEPCPGGVLSIHWRSINAETIMLKSICRLVENALGEQNKAKTLFCDRSLVFMTDAFFCTAPEALRASLQDVHFFVQENFTQQLRFIYSTRSVSLQNMPAYLDQVRALGERSYLFDSPVLAVDERGRVNEEDIAKWFDHLQECFSDLHGTPKQNDTFCAAIDSLRSSIGAPRTDVLRGMYEVTVLLAQSARQITPDLLTHCHDYLAQARTFRSMMSIINKQILPLVGMPNTPYTRLLHTAIQFMSDNLENELTLKQVASHVNLSPGYFSTLLKNETGMRFTEYLGDLRLHRAQELLKDGELSVNEVAQKCGYTDTAYFSRSFKKYLGVSPSRWRKG